METTITDDLLEQAARRLAGHCRMHQLRLAVAESCTGGWLAKCCTDPPGSSDWFERGYVVYSNNAKHDSLNLSTELIAREGAVSQATVEAMARALAAQTGCALACAISGVAGPAGGSEHTPVGTVWFAFMDHGRVESNCQQFEGDRDQVRRAAVLYALRQLVEETRER